MLFEGLQTYAKSLKIIIILSYSYERRSEILNGGQLFVRILHS